MAREGGENEDSQSSEEERLSPRRGGDDGCSAGRCGCGEEGSGISIRLCFLAGISLQLKLY